MEILDAREVPLGGPRGLTVRRTLPQRRRSLIGAWCFADSYGPTPAIAAKVMNVPPHPHTGLQTVSWLYAGRIEHRDSVGSHVVVEPGQVNLMTAGRGIQHSEVSLADARALHGVQLWVALPDSDRFVDPFFEHHVPQPVCWGSATLRVFVGELAGFRSPVTCFSGLVGAQLDLPAGAEVHLPVDPAFEHGLLVDSGHPTLVGSVVPAGRLGVVGTGSAELVVTAGSEPVRALLIGGRPLGEQVVMWWNFLGRSHDEIVEFRNRWQREVIGGGDRDGLFGAMVFDGPPLPAPELPATRLRPRS